MKFTADTFCLHSNMLHSCTSDEFTACKISSLDVSRFQLTEFWLLPLPIQAHSPRYPGIFRTNNSFCCSSLVSQMNYLSCHPHLFAPEKAVKPCVRYELMSELSSVLMNDSNTKVICWWYPELFCQWALLFCCCWLLLITVTETLIEMELARTQTLSEWTWSENVIKLLIKGTVQFSAYSSLALTDIMLA